jgi:lauroyl/myristoyl acyltransferase
MTAAGDAITDAAYGAGWSTVRRLPERSAYALFERIADVTWARRGKQVRRLESNLHRVVGPAATDAEIRHLSRAAMRSYLRYWCDSFRLPGWSKARIVDSIVIHDDQVLTDALARGKGVVVALPHMGNWDHAGAWASLAHRQVVTVAERLKPEDVYEKFLAYRRALGMEILPLTGGDPPFPILMRRLRAGGLIALLGDRDLTKHGLPVQFFGAEARFPAGPAALAIQTGASLLAATLWWEDGHNHAHLHLIDLPQEGDKSARIQAATQLVADVFAVGIAAHPADWHMLQRLWTGDLASIPESSEAT